jgi:TusA-related sulfurtransferase
MYYYNKLEVIILVKFEQKGVKKAIVKFCKSGSISVVNFEDVKNENNSL